MSACWVRPVTPLDGAAVAKLARRLRREVGPAARGAAAPAAGDDPGRTWVVEAGRGEIVGCCGVAEQADGAWRVRALFLAPEWRGLGLGRLLMETAIRACQAEGALRVLFTPAARGPEAATLARALGFRPHVGGPAGELVRELGRAS